MKQFIVLLLLGFSFMAKAQDRIKFEYDTAGNQIQRRVCINCGTTSKTATKKSAEIVATEETTFQKFTYEDTFSYYPNPVKEELHLKWHTTDGNSIIAIHVFDLSGRLLNRISNLKNQNTQHIAFQSYPSGVYEVILEYQNNTSKTIKIIKN